MFDGIIPSTFIASTTEIISDLLGNLSDPIILIISILAVGVILDVILHRK